MTMIENRYKSKKNGGIYKFPKPTSRTNASNILKPQL